MEHVSENDFSLYKDVMAGCYKFHDLILGRLMALAGQDTTIILCSDHGYLSDHLRPKETPHEPAGPAAWHREYGVIAMAGPGIKRGERVYGASLLDITPTVLTLLGLPAAKDMDGKILTQAIDQPAHALPIMIDSWEDVPGDAGMHDKAKREDPFAAQQAMRQLVELGYIEQPDEDDEKAAEDAAREAKYNLAQSYLDGGLLDEAADLLEQLFTHRPDQYRFGIALARVYMRQRRFESVRTLAEKLISAIEKNTSDRADQIDQAIQTIDNDPEQAKANAQAYLDRLHEQMIQTEAKRAEQEQREPTLIVPPKMTLDQAYLANRRQQLQDAATRMRGYDIRSLPMANLLLGRIQAIEGNFGKAIEHLSKVEQIEPRMPGLHLQLGQTYLQMRRNEQAANAFAKAIEIDADNAQAHEGLAAAYTRLHRDEEAVDHALTAVELMHNLPQAHLRLGVTLTRLGVYDKAAQAFSVCLKLAPATPAAHRYLAMLYRKHLGRPDLAQHHRGELQRVLRERRAGARAKRKTLDSGDARPVAGKPGRPTGLDPAVDPEQVITVVSGLPRTGTSMMMQMLIAGGIEPLTDGHRTADDSNPRGYYELDQATQLATDTSWVGQARGKAVKIVAQLLPKLPDIVDGRLARYRVVFMDRDLTEVVASQRTMLDRQGRKGADLSPDQLAKVYREQLEAVYQMLADRNIPWLMVRHADAINHPGRVAEQLKEAFGGILNAPAMTAAVDPTLYRERKPST